MKIKFEGSCPYCQKRIELIRELNAELISEICQQARKPAEPETKGNLSKGAEQPSEQQVDMVWLKESLQKLQWTGVGKYLSREYNVTGAKVSEQIGKMTIEQIGEFVKEVEERLQMA